jgi:hypothetical protein
MIAALIGNLILGAIIGYAGRLALPGAQNLSPVQTVGVGVLAALVGFFIFSWFWLPITFVLTVILAAAGIKIGMDKGFLKEQA